MSSVTIIGADPTGASSMARIPFPPNAVHMLDELKRAQNEDRTVGVAVTGDDFRNATLISVMVFAAEADPKSNKRK
jgi:hypothetical protein